MKRSTNSVSERQHFNRIAKNYSQKYEYEHCNDAIIREVNKLIEYKKVLGDLLEIGCGSGNLYEELRPFSKSYLGIDISEPLVRIALDNKVSSTDHFIVGDAASMGLAEESVDTVLSYGVLHHIPTYNTVIEQIHRVLRKNGILFLSETNGDAVFVNLLRAARKILDPRYSSKQFTFKKSDLTNVLQVNGFKVLRIEYSMYMSGFFFDSKYKYLPSAFVKFMAKHSLRIDDIIESRRANWLRREAFGIMAIAQKT